MGRQLHGCSQAWPNEQSVGYTTDRRISVLNHCLEWDKFVRLTLTYPTPDSGCVDSVLVVYLDLCRDFFSIRRRVISEGAVRTEEINVDIDPLNQSVKLKVAWFHQNKVSCWHYVSFHISGAGLIIPHLMYVMYIRVSWSRKSWSAK